MEKLSELLVQKELTTKEWLTYYKNIWLKNVIARTIDMQCDITMCEKNPNELVMEYDMEFGRPTGQAVKVSERLNTRKSLVKDALDLLDAINILLTAEIDEGVDFVNKYWSDDALKMVKEETKPAVETPKTEEVPKVEENKEEAKV